jgi:hypothetical protein
LLQKLQYRQGGYELTFDGSVPVGDLKRGSHLYVRLDSQLQADSLKGIKVKTKSRIRMGVPQHLVLNYDGSGKAAGVRLFLDAKLLSGGAAGSFDRSIWNFGQLEIGNKAFEIPAKQLDDLRLSTRVDGC